MTPEELNAHVKSGEILAHRVLDPWARDCGMIRRPAPYFECADGFSVSIQASATSYCTPRDNFGPYTEFELGFPNRYDKLIVEYAEDEITFSTVYPRVPIHIVLKLIDKHGGPKHEAEKQFTDPADPDGLPSGQAGGQDEPGRHGQ